MYANNPEIFMGGFEAKATRARVPLVCFISPLLKDNQSQQTRLHPCLTFATITGGQYDVPPPRTSPTPQTARQSLVHISAAPQDLVP